MWEKKNPLDFFHVCPLLLHEKMGGGEGRPVYKLVFACPGRAGALVSPRLGGERRAVLCVWVCASYGLFLGCVCFCPRCYCRMGTYEVARVLCAFEVVFIFSCGCDGLRLCFVPVMMRMCSHALFFGGPVLAIVETGGTHPNADAGLSRAYGGLWMKGTTWGSCVSDRHGRSRFPPTLLFSVRQVRHVRSLLIPTLFNPVTSALRSLPVLCHQVNAIEGVCHFNMRVAQETGMVSRHSARLCRQRLA